MLGLNFVLLWGSIHSECSFQLVIENLGIQFTSVEFCTILQNSTFIGLNNWNTIG